MGVLPSVGRQTDSVLICPMGMPWKTCSSVGVAGDSACAGAAAAAGDAVGDAMVACEVMCDSLTKAARI